MSRLYNKIVSNNFKAFGCAILITAVTPAKSQTPISLKENDPDLVKNLPITFRQNVGQWDNNVHDNILYQGSSPGWNANVYFMKNKLSFGFSRQAEETKTNYQSDDAPSQAENQEYLVWNLHFKNANPDVVITAEGKEDSHTNYLTGNDFSQHQINVPDYRIIKYNNIYPNIDVRYYSTGKNLKYDYIVNQEGDINDIQMTCEGIKKLSINNLGQLEIHTQWGILIEELPESYQIINKQKQQVKINYQIINDSTFSFKAYTRYNKNHPLIIDPVILKWSTFVGGNGSGNGYICDITKDQQGNIYGVGWYNNVFPTTSGAFITSLPASSRHGYVFKLNPSGTSLIYSTYLGGTTGTTAINAIAVNTSGEAFICGVTTSPSFPVTSGAFNTVYPVNFNRPAFISKLNATGSSLLYSTFIGGSSTMGQVTVTEDACTAIELNSAGEIYVAGMTYCNDFPVTPGAFDTGFNGAAGFQSDAFLLKLDPAGNGVNDLLFSTYIGGTGYDYGFGLKINLAGEIFVCGSTASANFPVTAGAYDTSHNGNHDIFVCKFNSTLSSQIYSTFIGGSDRDLLPPIIGSGYYNSGDITINNSDEVYIVGNTKSANFPLTAGAFDTFYSGGPGFGLDAIICKLNSTGSTLLYSSYLGGSGQDEAYGVALNSAGDVFITGYTGSTDFPITSCAYDNSHNGGTHPERGDIFVCKFNPSLNTILYGTYLGGGNSDYWYPRVLLTEESCGEVELVVCGTSHSGNFPITAGTYQSSKANGTNDQPLVFKLKPVITPDFSFSSTLCSQPVTFTDLTSGSCIWSSAAWNPTQWQWNFGDGSTSTLQNPIHTYTSAGSYSVTLIVNCPRDSIIKTIVVGGSCSFTAQATSQSICTGGCATLSVFAASGTTPYTYNWSGGQTGQTISICPTVNTTYTVTVTDSLGNVSSDTAAVQIASSLNNNSTATHVTCNGQSNGLAMVNPSGGTAPYTYSWSSGGTQSTISNLTTGNYSVTITDLSGCMTNTVISITEPFALSLTSNTTTANCNQGTGSITLNPSGGSGPYTYLWSSASGGNSTTQQISNLSSATYSVTVTDNNGCTIARAITVGNMPGVTAQANNIQQASCFGNCNGAAIISGSGGTTPYTYLWSNGATNSVANNLCATVYSVTVADGAGCFSFANVSITEPSPISTVTSRVNVSCNAGNDGSVGVTVSGGTGTYTYSWSSASGGNSTNQQINNLIAGNYSVTITDASGCRIDTVININEPSAISYTVTSSNETCGQGNGSAIIHITGGTPGYFYSWSSASGGSGIGNDTSITNQSSGTYTIYVQDNNGCFVQSTATINNIGNPASILQQPNICLGSTYTLPDGTITSTSGIYSHTLNTVAGCDSVITTQLTITQSANNTISPIACNNYIHNSQTYSTSGIYTQTLSTLTGCDSILTINLTITNNISTADTQSICGGQSAIIHGISQDTAGIYTQTFFATGGCDSTSTITLQVENTPSANAGNDTTILMGQTVILSASGTGTYLWNTGDTSTTANIQPTSTTVFILTVTGNNGCATNDTITIFIDTPCDDNTEVFVPNSFSPNADGQNDFLQLYSTGSPETLYFVIFNRWGEKVFETEDLQKTWDGTYRNMLADTAVFTWILKITCKGESTENIRTGTLNLIR